MTWRRPLTSVTEDKVVVLLGCCWPVDALCTCVWLRSIDVVVCWGFSWKTLSAPWSKVLWELLQPSLLHLRGLLPCLNKCLSRKQEKQSYASAMTLAHCVGVFSLKTRHSHSWWLPLPTMQLVFDVDVELCCGLRLLLCCVFAANAFKATFVLVTELLVSSIFALVAVFFFKLCASAYSFNQSLKSRRVGFTQCFLTVKSDHDSFILGGSFCTAVLRSTALLKSESYESDLKTPTRFEMHPEQLMMLSPLCILNGGKLLNLSNWALTTACDWPNFRCKVLSASLYIAPQ